MPWITPSLASAISPSSRSRSAQSAHTLRALPPTLTLTSLSTSSLHSRQVGIGRSYTPRGHVPPRHSAGSFPAEEVPRDHDALDLRRPLVDLEQLRVAHQLLDRVLLRVAVAAEDLDGVGGRPHRGVGAVRLRVAR